MSFSAELDFSLFLSNKSIEERLAESAAKIAYYNFDWRFITFVFFNTTLLYGEGVFLKFYNKSMIVSQSEYDMPHAKTTKQYVLFGTDNENIEFILRWMQKHEFDSTGKHVIVCLSENKMDCNESEAMRILWHYKVTNIVFIRRAFNEMGVVGYTYYPLEDSLCDMGPPIILTNLDACIDITCKDNCRMFPRKLNNFHGCSLVVSTFEFPPNIIIKNMSKLEGVNGDMIWLLGERLNATIKIVTPRKSSGWGVRQSDGSWVGTLGDVYHDFANITFGVVMFKRVQYFDISVSHSITRLVWMTCPTQFEPSSLKLLRPFSKYTHIAVATTYALVIGSALLTNTKFWCELSTKTNTKHLRFSRSSVVFYSWMLFMGLPTNVLPKKRILLAIVYIWIWYTFLIRTIYQASLINSLKRDVHLPNYDTIEAAIDAGFQFGGNIALKEYYLDSSVIYNNWIAVNPNESESTMIKVSEGFKFVDANSLESVRSFHRKLKDRKLYVLPQLIGVNPSVAYLKKFSPLVEPVNYVLQRIIESGFRNKFSNDYGANVPTGKDRNTNEPMTLEHLKGCYIILLTGWTISFVICIYEIIFGKWMQIN